MTGIDPAFWNGKRVFVTGHTGFKGGWLTLWLHALGAEVHGFSLAPPTDPNLFDVADIRQSLATHTIGDIRDAAVLSAAMRDAGPEIVFHLAAQPLVRYSYEHPVETYAVNVMGVVHLLEAVRATRTARAVVNITTDKCYENRERSAGYREDEPMGGRDPYSSSKGCSELVTSAYRRSFFADAGVAVATARAGNVIGGGDWATDRLVPDLLRAIDSKQTLNIRRPDAIRPWQHVLEPVAGYLMLAERLYKDGKDVGEAWNFGPSDADAQTVGWIVDRLASACPGMTWQRDASPSPHEAHYLKLDSTKARTRLHWLPRWDLRTALDKTLSWHMAWRDRQDMKAVTLGQIREYAV